MKWYGPRPATPPIVTMPEIAAQLRVTSDDEGILLADYVDAATEYAEQALDSSLLTRTITATYYRRDGDVHSGSFVYMGRGGRLFLPRGPVQQIQAVADAAGTSFGTADYQLEAEGNRDLLRMLRTWTPPLQVTYSAGYGSLASNVPADIRMAIRTHAATLYEQRTSADEKTITPVPHSLEAFYALRRRTPPVG